MRQEKALTGKPLPVSNNADLTKSETNRFGLVKEGGIILQYEHV